MATTDAPAQIPDAGIGPVEERELPSAPSLGKMIGPGVILVGVGIASGEYILFPYIASQVGLAFLWAAIAGLTLQLFINMEVERYTLATGETAITGFQRLWRPFGLVMVPALITQPGHMFGMIAQPTISSPNGRQSRWKPVIAVSPVASV